MAARRYEISLLVLKKIFHSCGHVISPLSICIYIYIYIFFFFLAETYVQLRHHCGRGEKHVISPGRDFAIRLITA